MRVTPWGTRRGGLNFGSGCLRVGGPVAAGFGDFDEAGAEGERRMAGEVGDDEHLVAQRGDEEQIDLDMMRAISWATLRRRRSVCTKSTAERKRDWRKMLGQASGTWAFSWSTWWLRVSSSKAAAAFGEENEVE